MIKTDYGAINCARRTAAEAKINAECPLAVGDDVKKSVSVSATAFVVSVEDKGATTLAKAKVAFDFVYLAEDGFRKAEAFAEAETELPTGGAVVRVTAEETRIVRNSENYVARCTVRFTAESSVGEEKKIVVGGDGLLVKEIDVKLDEPTGVNSDEFVVTDEFELGYAVKEVLGKTQAVRLKKVESGVSRIIFEGETEICVKTLPMNDSTDIMREKRSIPFRFELPCAGALPDMKATGEMTVTKVAYKVFTDEAKGKSNVSAEITLKATGEAAGERTERVVVDAYSREDETAVSKTTLTTYRLTGRGYREERIIGATDGEVPDGGRILVALGENVTVYSVTATEQGANLTGVIRADVVFRNADNGTTCVQAEMPFSADIADEGMICGVKVELTELNARVRNGAIEFEANLAIEWTTYEKQDVICAEDVTASGERTLSDSAISVVIPKAGDDLWEVSKRLGINEDEILKLNPDLEFPLGGDERIIIYRQKT